MGSSVIFECPKCNRTYGEFWVGVGRQWLSIFAMSRMREEVMTNPEFAEQKKVLESDEGTYIRPMRAVFQCEHCKSLYGEINWSVYEDLPRDTHDKHDLMHSKAVYRHHFKCDRCDGECWIPDEYVCPDCGQKLVQKRGKALWD